MKKTIIRMLVCIVTFVTSLIVISNLLNQGNTDMTVEMSPATLPLIYMNVGDEQVNRLYGYTVQPDISYERSTITPLGEGRSVSAVVDTYGNLVTAVSFEVRSVDGSRLIQDGELEYTAESASRLSLAFSIKDLIDDNTEYNLSLILELSSEKNVYYNTRIIMAQNYHAEDKVAFARTFSEQTFDKEEAQNLVKYLESDSTGDNSTLGVVTIHSSFQQITWGTLPVTKETEPVFQIREMAEQTASIEGEYIVSVTDGGTTKIYRIKEFYRLRYTVDRIYLLDFERTMTQIFDETDADSFVGRKIVLGIQSEDVTLVESDGGNTFAFVNDGKLYAYNVAEDKIAVLFSFYDRRHNDARDFCNHHGIKILSIDETGNVRFTVYGYMNRGRHEGEVGIAVYYYNSMLNTVEEEIYIPYEKSYDILETEMKQLSYVSKSNLFYFILNGDIYAISLESHSYDVIADNLEEGQFQVSDDQSMLVWQEGGRLDYSTRLVLMNLNTQSRTTVEAGEGNYCKPIGFMGNDLIYGIAHMEDVITDSTGITTFGMHMIRIQNENGEILKEYSADGIYVTGGEIDENQLTLYRAVKTEDGTSYVDTTEDQILNNAEIQEGVNIIEKPVTENYETIIQIAVKDEIDGKALKILTPKEVLFEGDRNLAIEEDNDIARYYVYAKDGVIGIFSSAANAINLAYDNAGVVVNDSGRYIWIRGNRSTRNQIMAISANGVTDEEGALAVCLDTILAYDGILRNSQHLLNEGETVLSILQENLQNATILDLSGCSLDAILYYVNMDIPVLAMLESGDAVLIIGFNDSQIVLMNPKTDSLYKMNITDASEWFTESDAVFISYIRY